MTKLAPRVRGGIVTDMKHYRVERGLCQGTKGCLQLASGLGEG